MTQTNFVTLEQGVELSALAYAEPDVFEAAAAHTVPENVTESRLWSPAAGPNQGYVICTPSRVIVGLKGTDFLDEQSAWQNIRTRAVTRNRLHEGYVDGVDELRDRGLTDYVKEKQAEKWRTLIVVGHSAGGGLADVLAGELWEMRRESLKANQVITVAAPMTAKGVLWPALQQRRFSGDRHRYTRLAAVSDPVPWLPLRLMGWRHAYPARYLNRHNDRLRNPLLMYMLADGLMNRIKTRKILKAGGIAHTVEQYLFKLNHEPRE